MHYTQNRPKNKEIPEILLYTDSPALSAGRMDTRRCHPEAKPNGSGLRFLGYLPEMMPPDWKKYVTTPE